MAPSASSSFSLRDPTFSSAPSFSLLNFLPSTNTSQQLTADDVVATYEGEYGASVGIGGTVGGGTAGGESDGESWRGGHSGGSAVGIHSAPRVSYYFPKGVGEYHFGERHPMKPHRLTLTNHLVIGYGLHKRMDVYEPRAATKEELEMFHDEDYVDFLARVTPDNVRHFTSVLSRFNIGDDCPIFADQYSYCRQYAGASLAAARKLVSGTTDIAVNWTGGLHHAKKSEASGFCYVNDIVLAILELLRVHARVLYIDIDIHHGDGVQEAFYNSNRVLTVSFHKYSPDFFPGTGHIDELGHALGKYFSLNVPLQDGIDNESYVALFKSIMGPTIDTFRPSAIVLQCGADSLGCDRLGCFNLSIAAHGECVRFIKSFDLPLVVLGGGGYTIKNVSRCWTYETAVLLGLEQDLPNALPHTAYDDFFAPDWKLHPELAGGRNRLENLNSRKQLERIRVAVLERLRYMAGAPGVQMSEVPPSLASWMADEEERGEGADEDDGAGEAGNARGRDEHRDRADYFASERDREGDDGPAPPLAPSAALSSSSSRRRPSVSSTAPPAADHPATKLSLAAALAAAPPVRAAAARSRLSGSAAPSTPTVGGGAAGGEGAAGKKRRKVEGK